jgi:RimJ/RimL family protein N-acetyltransferase
MTPLHEVDLLEYYEICSSDDGIEEVTKHVGWTPHENPAETASTLEEAANRWNSHRGAGYVIRPLEDEDGAGEIAGMTGLLIDWDRNVACDSIWLRKRFWGRGYSLERIAPLLALAFDRLNVAYVEAVHMDDNENSRSALKKYVEAYGGRDEGLLRGYQAVGPDSEGARDVYRCTIAREEFEANRPGEYEF